MTLTQYPSQGIAALDAEALKPESDGVQMMRSQSIEYNPSGYYSSGSFSSTHGFVRSGSDSFMITSSGAIQRTYTDAAEALAAAAVPDSIPGAGSPEQPQGAPIVPPRPTHRGGMFGLFKKSLPRIPDYTVPAWAQDENAEAAPWYLECFKGPLRISTVDLSERTRWLCGRSDSDSVDFNLGTHHTISRRHAVIQHSYDGGLWLYDLASVQGTKLNQNPVQPHTFVKLLPGNSIQFGRSNRIYIVHEGSCNRQGAGTFQIGHAAQRPRVKNYFSDLSAALQSARNATAQSPSKPDG